MRRSPSRLNQARARRPARRIPRRPSRRTTLGSRNVNPVNAACSVDPLFSRDALADLPLPFRWFFYLLAIVVACIILFFASLTVLALLSALASLL